MKKLRKVFAVLLTLAMVLGLSMTSFAAEKPTDNDAQAITLQDFAAGTTFKAYQIIDAEYTDDGFAYYKWAAGTGKTGKVNFVTKSGVDGKVAEGLDDTLITNLAKNPGGLTEKADYTAATPLEVGTWMIIATSPDKKVVYNPMIASVYYTVSGNDNTMGNGEISAKDSWELYGTTAYAKSTTISVEKNVSNSGTEEVGQEVTFTLEGTIPSYSAEYASAKYTLTDTIVNGLEYVGDIDVKVGGATPATGKYTETYTNAVASKSKSFEVDFDSAYILGLADATEAERKVVITYNAKITTDAIETVGQNNVKLDYTTTPGHDDGSTTKTKYTYTCSLDGVFEKLDDENKALAGAQFTLYKTKNGNTLSDQVAVSELTTTENNKITFTNIGLDGNDTYYLRETKAPSGYSINETIYTIEFANKIFDTDGKITAYDVMVNGEKVSTISYGTPSTSNMDIVNTKLNSLPSTGGIGTTIFTIGGCAIMVIAAALFFASRRKSAK